MKAWRVYMDKCGNVFGKIESIPIKFIDHDDEYNNYYPPGITKAFFDDKTSVVLPKKDVYLFQVVAKNSNDAIMVAHKKRSSLVMMGRWYSTYESWKNGKFYYQI